jgi:hypothetical protein
MSLGNQSIRRPNQNCEKFRILANRTTVAFSSTQQEAWTGGLPHALVLVDDAIALFWYYILDRLEVSRMLITGEILSDQERFALL